MKYSDIALKVLVAKELGLIKSNAQFATDFSEQDNFLETISQSKNVEKATGNVINQYLNDNEDEGFICAYDKEFPIINITVKNSDKPYLLFYKGDLSLLKDLNKNVAVIGLTDPTPQIEKREIEVVSRLVNSKIAVVSGLAKGCDAIAHKVCMDCNGKTIAILPSQISKITPAVNKNLAKCIFEKGGLLLTEYYKDPNGRQDAIGRFIERDRLQAMFSKVVIMIASYRKNEGDSGSRHAMQAALNYGLERYIMFNEVSDENDKQFGLNKDFLNGKNGSVKILNKSSIEVISNIINTNLVNCPDNLKTEQLKFF